jgi:hypothetical protein
MLNSVIGSSLLHGSRALARCSKVGVLALGLLGPLAAPSVALAQSNDSGWFEGRADTALDDQPYYNISADDQAAPGAQAPQAPAPQAAAPQQAPQADVPDTDPSALTTFKPALDPYGAWVNDPTYGTVWVPNRAVVGEDFAPYVSRGHWALTADDDWIWVSDYPFGWAVFHYGRWVWAGGSGWVWVPGRTYANAWVTWRTGYDGYGYVGWAPMAPTWGWYNGYAFGVWYRPPLPYVFCPSAYVFDYRVHYHIVRDRYMVSNIAAHTRVYPTTYHTPASPSVRGAAAPGVRSAAVPGVGVPHGPAMSAAHIPPQSVPAVRTLPSTNATRLSGTRIATTSYARPQMQSSQSMRFAPSRGPSPSARAYSSAYSGHSVPSNPWAGSRAPSSVHYAPAAQSYTRSYSPSHVAPARSYSAPSYSAPSHSYSAPHSYSSSHFSPSFSHMHGGGGGHHR